MIWAVNRYVHRYRLTDRLLANTPLWAAPWIQLRTASHYYIIKIIRHLDNRKSIWLYLFYNYIAASRSIWTMPIAPSTSPCRTTFPPFSINTNILHLNLLSIHHILGTYPHMKPHNNLPRHQIPPPYSNYQRSNASRKLWALYFTMPEQWMQQC